MTTFVEQITVQPTKRHMCVWFIFGWITLHGTCQQNKHTKTLLCISGLCEMFPILYGQKQDGKPISVGL